MQIVSYISHLLNQTGKFSTTQLSSFQTDALSSTQKEDSKTAGLVGKLKKEGAFSLGLSNLKKRLFDTEQLSKQAQLGRNIIGALLGIGILYAIWGAKPSMAVALPLGGPEMTPPM